MTSLLSIKAIDSLK